MLAITLLALSASFLLHILYFERVFKRMASNFTASKVKFSDAQGKTIVEILGEPEQVKVAEQEVFDVDEHYYPLNQKGYTIETPEELLKDFGNFLFMIKGVLACSDSKWDNLVLPVINNVADFVQKLPASKDNHHYRSKGLLAHSLEVSLFALKSSQHELFKVGYPMEIGKFMEEKWNMGAFLAGLLHDLSKPVSDIIVKDETREHTWNGFTKTITEWAREKNITRYVFRHNSKRAYSDHEVINNVVSARILTPEIKEYLTEFNDDVLTALLHVISGQTSSTRPKTTKLFELVKAADGESVKRDKEAYLTPEEKKSQKLSPVERVILGLEQMILKEDGWGVNRPGAAFFVNDKGVFAVWDKSKTKKIKEYVSKLPGNEDLARLPEAVISGILEDSGLFLRKNDRSTWKGAITIDGWKEDFNLSYIKRFDVAQAVIKRMYSDNAEPIKFAIKDPNGDFTRPPYNLSDFNIEEKIVDESVPEEGEKAEANPKEKVAKEKQASKQEDKKEDNLEFNFSDSESQSDSDEENETFLPESSPENSNEIKQNHTEITDDVEQESHEESDNQKLLNSLHSHQLPQLPTTKKKKTTAPPQSTPKQKIDLTNRKSTPNIKIQQPSQRGPLKPQEEGFFQSSIDEKKIAEFIDPENNPHLNELMTQGETGSILSAIGVSLLLGELGSSDVFEPFNGYIALSWPKAFSLLGGDEKKVRDKMILEGAFVEVEANHYLQELKSPSNKLVSCYVVNPVFSAQFIKAFWEPGRGDNQPEKARKTSTPEESGMPEQKNIATSERNNKSSSPTKPKRKKSPPKKGVSLEDINGFETNASDRHISLATFESRNSTDMLFMTKLGQAKTSASESVVPLDFVITLKRVCDESGIAFDYTKLSPAGIEKRPRVMAFKATEYPLFKKVLEGL